MRVHRQLHVLLGDELSTREADGLDLIASTLSPEEGLAWADKLQELRQKVLRDQAMRAEEIAMLAAGGDLPLLFVCYVAKCALLRPLY